VDLWLLVFFLVLVQPLLGWWRFRRFVGREPVISTKRKMRLYAMVVGTQWVLTALCAWIMRRRDLDIGDLGLLEPGKTLAWVAASFLIVMFASATIAAVRSIRDGKAELPSHLRHVVRILPVKGIERAGFVPVALTAGICEEILYRGFLTFALFHVIRSWPAALALSTLAFGFGHLYQGPRGVVSTALLGGLLAAIYGYWQSLWPCIAVHAVVDLVSGNALGTLAAPAPAPGLALTPPAPHTEAETGRQTPPEETTGT